MNIPGTRNLYNLGAVSILFFAVLLSTSCGKATTKTEAAPPPPVTVVVADVVEKTVPIYSEFVGQTKAHETVELRARVEGVLQKIYFREGTPVRRGQLLFTIDKRQYQAAVQSARATVAKAEADLAQSRQRTDVLQAQAELADADATQSLRIATPLALHILCSA